MGLISKIKTGLLVSRVVDRLKEAQMKGTAMTTVVALAGAVFTGVVAKLTEACPTLLAQLPTLLAAGAAAGVALWLRSPKDAVKK